MANPNQESNPQPQKNRPEVQTPPVPVRNLPEHEIEASDTKRADLGTAGKPSIGANKTLEPEAPEVQGEAAP